MRRSAKALMVTAVLLVAGSSARAQQADCARVPLLNAPADSAAASAKPDMVLAFTVRAREVRFDSEPRLSVNFLGCPGLDSLVILRRENLPKPVQSGVTYNNVVISGELRSYFAQRCLQTAAPGDSALTRGLLANLCAAPSGAADSTQNRATNPSRRQP